VGAACAEEIPVMEPETMTLSDAKVSLYRKAVRLADINQDCDRMVVQEFTGHEDNVFIYREPEPNGKRRVARIRQTMSTQVGSSPAIPVTTTFGTVPERVTDAAEEQRLLKLYDLFAAKK
jgi:hypothetical protein